MYPTLKDLVTVHVITIIMIYKFFWQIVAEPFSIQIETKYNH